MMQISQCTHLPFLKSSSSQSTTTKWHFSLWFWAPNIGPFFALVIKGRDDGGLWRGHSTSLSFKEIMVETVFWCVKFCFIKKVQML